MTLENTHYIQQHGLEAVPLLTKDEEFDLGRAARRWLHIDQVPNLPTDGRWTMDDAARPPSFFFYSLPGYRVPYDQSISRFFCSLAIHLSIHPSKQARRDLADAMGRSPSAHEWAVGAGLSGAEELEAEMWQGKRAVQRLVRPSLCPSVRPSVRPSVVCSVDRRSSCVGWMDRWALTKLINHSTTRHPTTGQFTHDIRCGRTSGWCCPSPRSTAPSSSTTPTSSRCVGASFVCLTL